MSRLTRGRIVRGLPPGPGVGTGAGVAPALRASTTSLPASLPGTGRARRLAEREVLAAARARAIVSDAKEAAERLVEATRERAIVVAAEVVEDAQAAERARFSAHYLALRAEDERRAERDLDRVLETAILLAERLVGRSLQLDPTVVTALARRALDDVRGARHALVEAHPDDVPALRADLAALGFPEGTVAVEPGPGLARGDLSLHTDLGTVHARITPQLERLSRALREALREP